MDQNTAQLIQPLREHMETYVNEWINEYNTDLAERLGHISTALHRMEEELEKCDEKDLARLVQSGADSIESISREVRDGQARDIMEILERQGREHPAGALLASMTAGFLSTRAARHREGNGSKASGTENRESTSMSAGQEPGSMGVGQEHTDMSAGRSSPYSPAPAQADLNIKKGG